ncbi:MAG: HTH-type transcriptional repressor CytR [Microbacteriaceae bacterium]|jgi:LacI family transcriptional regulator|nr:HTH-type transcriptional repressor CytR [Microbacteriaceae bacterium]
MSSRATIADVARLAGVHPGTVSRALNRKTESQVNPETVGRVRSAAKQLGYTPNSIARGLRTSSSMTVGVIIPDLTNPIFPPIVRGIDSHLAPLGYSAVVVNTDGSDQAERLLFESLVQRQVDGFIFATGHSGHSIAGEAYERGIRAVMVNRDSRGVPFPAAVGDDAQGIRESLHHLWNLGHRRIVHLAGPPGFSTSQIRAESFVSECAVLGIQGEVVQTAAYSVEAGQATMDLILERPGPRPSAVVAGNDLLALGVYHSLRTHGLRCPDDVSVVGFNDMPFAGDFQPPMTTVRAPHFELGAEAARLLVNQIEHSILTALRVVLPVELIVRASTGPVA